MADDSGTDSSHSSVRPSTAKHPKVRAWLARQPNIEVLFVNYNDLVDRPAGEAERVSAFLGGKADAQSMSKTVDPSLYRNRKIPVECPNEPIAGGTA